MDNQTQSFLELSAKNDLVQLVADKRAAWLWSADGARILWTNAAGASFFSAQTIADLGTLTSLERSPARPHIARIATSGLTDRFSIDRLRFYRGLRVMLLTCQCKRVELETGETAALIVCSDKGLALTKEPIPAFAQLIRSTDTTAFLMSGGTVDESFGELTGTPEDLDLPESQRALFGPLDLNGDFHEGVILQIPAGPKIVLLENDALSDETSPEDVATDDAPVDEIHSEVPFEADEQIASLSSETQAHEPLSREPLSPELLATGTPAPVSLAAAGASAATEPDDAAATDKGDLTSETDTDEIAEASEAFEDGLQAETEFETDAETDQEPLSGEEDTVLPVEDVRDEMVETSVPDLTAEIPSEDNQTEKTASGADEPAFDEADTEDAHEGEPELTAAPVETPEETVRHETFAFQPRRRPVRFAWKMDADQRFTFLSDEFAEVLGPAATDITGLSWDTVSRMFDLDPRGNISRALDRRDTWSGKTVNWPVSGATLRVPVDMAALPAFDRNRKFEGYRGFGVCRTADALQDPDNPIAAPEAAFLSVSAPEAPETDTDTTAFVADVASVVAEDLSDAEGPIDPVSEPTAPDVKTEDLALAEEFEAGTAEIEEKVDDLSLPETEPETSPAPTSAPAPQKLEDLKPAQPNSFAGKTFLGASAAALVGSLAKITGKSEPEFPANSSPSTENVNLKQDLQSAAAALDGMTETVDTQPDGDKTERSSEDEFHRAEPANEDAAKDETEDVLHEKGDPQETLSNNLTEEPADDQREDFAASLREPSTDAPDAEPEEVTEAGNLTETETLPEADELPGPETTPGSEELTGISGTAELKPAEIENAVKSLQKSFKASEKLKSLDLFEDETAEPDDSEAGMVSAEITQDASIEGEVSDEDTRVETAAEEQVSAVIVEDPADDEAEVTDEAVSAKRAEADVSAEEVNAEVDFAEDEREFFEETAAFGLTDQAAEASAGDALDVEIDAEETEEPDPEPIRTGEVIPLATARPRVVPVDTSSLSRPERQAFRKIAEALGARLEGDLEDFDSPDPEEEAIDDLTPDVPEAGPIDPTLLDRLPIGIAIVHDREVLYANKALLRMLGYKSIAALSRAGGLEALFIDNTEELPDAVGMDGEVDEAMKLRLADGGVLSVDAHMHSVPWNDSWGLMISITERPSKQGPAVPAAPVSSSQASDEETSELENARSQIAEMDTILETATDGVLVLDQHGTIVKVNGSAEALFSANRVDMIGAPFTDFLAPESHRAAADYLDGLSRNGVASILNDGREVLGKVPTGGLIPLFMTIGRITSAKEDAKYCAVLRDITQWKTAEEELTQAKRQAENASSQKSDFLAKISHEIRTPLNAIIGFSEVMMEERFGPIGNDRYKDYLKDIRTSGSHIMSLINDLLDLSKIEAGKLDLNFSAVSTNDVINECVALMQPQANRERVIIRASLPESVPDVVADPRSLRQIVLNLLSNAIKYNKSGGQVILSTALESNGEVALRVRDTGTGMTAKQLAAALEPFRQLHTASRGGGTGLGLPLTKALVEANRASFHIDSTPDQGTLVEIIFPTQRVLSE